MSEAKKLLSRSPKGMSRASSPSLVSLSDVTGSHIMDILNDITKDTANIDEKKSNGKGSGGGGNTGKQAQNWDVPNTNNHETR